MAILVTFQCKLEKSCFFHLAYDTENWILIILAIKLNLSFLDLYHYDETKQFNEYPQIIIWVQTIQQDSWKLVALMMTR